ncbi:hypothetical protein [Streptomyces chrestomyceticus]|uniref:hypothetical protein n=1 Tax=Streptomyces chrestomyceticus TaxID=68185 RepID=UPI0019D17B66|nr:hypothetical protein [Streptomyces chrestomyceticus]
MKQWHKGDRVMAAGETDHPEDPIGEVVSTTVLGEVIVVFPLAGAEMHDPDELVPAPQRNDSAAAP